MPYNIDKILIKNPLLDKRVKLLPEQKQDIRNRWALHCDRARRGLLGEALSQRKLAREYGVSRRTIVFILYPERRKSNYQSRVNNGGSKQYYDKLKPGEWAKTMRTHREYKKKLFNNGLIK